MIVIVAICVLLLSCFWINNLMKATVNHEYFMWLIEMIFAVNFFIASFVFLIARLIC